jgi:hypothetical protein
VCVACKFASRSSNEVVGIQAEVETDSNLTILFLESRVSVPTDVSGSGVESLRFAARFGQCRLSLPCGLILALGVVIKR